VPDRCALFWLAATVLLLTAGNSSAQELEPRAYSPAPVGLNFLVAAVADSSGGIAVDPTLPIEDADASFNTFTAGYLRTFALRGRTASLGASVPYAWGDITGTVSGEGRGVERAGFGDARLRMAVNLFGGPARTPQEFATREQGTQVGATILVSLPTGEYRSDRLINLGANRWATKLELGLYQPLGAWSFELATGVWFFGDNDEFFPDARREQDPVGSVQTHVAYTFRPGLWLAADWSYFGGGRTTVDGVKNADLQATSRIGATVSVPISRGQSVKLAWADGVSTRIGADLTTWTLAWQVAW
jgi:hypothetical protein